MIRGMIRIERGFLGAVLLSLLACLPLARAADDAFPGKPIRIIIPVTAGGWQDAMSRLVAQKMESNIGQSILIENRPSAGSVVGTQFVAKAAADGYTLLAVSNTFAISPAVVKSAGYAVSDFSAVGEMIRSPLLVLVGAGSRLNSMGDVIALAKKTPDGIPYASGGTGSTSHLVPEMFAAQAGIKLLHIPYKGNAPAIPDVLSGRVEFIFSPVSSAVSLINSGKLRAIGITSARRSALYTNVPTLREAGLQGFDSTVYSALLAPAGTPRAVLDRLKVSLDAAKGNADLIVRVREVGDEVAPTEPRERLDAFLAEEAQRYEKIVKEKGIKAE